MTSPEPATSFRVTALLRPGFGEDETVHVQDYPDFQQARRAGMKLACLTMTQTVTVHDAAGVLECTWRSVDEHGNRDNYWRNVGPVAGPWHRADLARILEQIRAGNAPGRSPR